jgi:hypothetical protein
MSSASYNYDATLYGAPWDYQIQISSDSVNGDDGEWTTVVDAQNNAVAARSHEIAGENFQWIRFRITRGGALIDEIDIHDLSQCSPGGAWDTWGFIGDSITADAFWRDAKAGTAFNRRVNELCPERYPSMINFGIGGNKASHVRDRLQATIDLNPAIYFWAIGVGTNYSGDVEQYEECMREIIKILSDNGKQPIIARIPYSRDVSMYERILKYNAVIKKLTKEYGLPPGPDLYSIFRYHNRAPGYSKSYFRDLLHPNCRGIEAINRLWADVAAGMTTA